VSFTIFTFIFGKDKHIASFEGSLWWNKSKYPKIYSHCSWSQHMFFYRFSWNKKLKNNKGTHNCHKSIY